MIEAVLAISILSSLGLVFYTIKKSSEDRKETIQEMAKIFLSKNMEEYVETIQEDNEEEEIVQDEIEEVDAVDERLLIEHLKKTHENIES